MLKLVILDDEKMERSYMKKYINWEELGIEIVGEASNGISGLNICEKLKPDVILTDILMPEMDGIEFSKKVKGFLPEVKIIFISGYGDFEYARSAVDLNAFGYILKPFRIEQVIEVIKKVISKCDDENRKNEERERLKRIFEENKGALKESLLRELIDSVDINNEVWERINYFGLNLSKGRYCILLIEIDEFTQIISNFSQEDKQLLSVNLINNIKEVINLNGQGEVVKFSEKRFTALLNFNPTLPYETSIQDVFLISEEIKNSILSKINVSVTIGVSRMSDDIKDLHILLEQAKDALKYKLFDLRGQSISINDIQLVEEKQEVNLKKLDSELVECLRLGNLEKIKILIDEIFSDIYMNKNTSQSYIQNICISIICSATRFLNEINCTFDDVVGEGIEVWSKLIAFETIADAKQWIKNIFLGIIETVNQKKKSKNRLIVDRIVQIINEKYDSNLTTKELSKDIFLSPNYIGVIFKEEMGISILEYTTKVRMEKAIELLKDPNMKIYEIAQMVGYNNTPYFSSLFREFTGMTPSESREKV